MDTEIPYAIGFEKQKLIEESDITIFRFHDHAHDMKPDLICEGQLKDMNLKVNPVGTVISANSASIGAAAILTKACVTNQTFIGLVCSDGLYNEFLYYYLKANVTTLKKMGTGTTILYISQDKYWNLPIPLPPLAEQKRIVQKLEEILPLCEKLK